MSEAIEKTTKGTVSLDEIVPVDGCDPRVGLKILGIRREILDRIYTIREMEGRRMRHEGEAIGCALRLKKEHELKSHEKMDLEGRRIEATAKSELCIEKTKHYQLEIQQYLRCLVSDENRPKGIRERLRQWLS